MVTIDVMGIGKNKIWIKMGEKMLTVILQHRVATNRQFIKKQHLQSAIRQSTIKPGVPVKNKCLIRVHWPFLICLLDHLHFAIEGRREVAGDTKTAVLRGQLDLERSDLTDSRAHAVCVWREWGGCCKSHIEVVP